MIYNNNNFQKEPVEFRKNNIYNFTSSQYNENKDIDKTSGNKDLINKIPKINIKRGCMYKNVLSQLKT